MSNVPDNPKYIQIEEVRFRSPDSESVMNKLAGTNNYLLNHYPVPSGALTAFAGPVGNIPGGYLLCNGMAVSRATYGLLFNAIGIGWGQGDGLTTFNLPDLRGYFLRMQDMAQGRDPDVAGRYALFTGGATGDNVGSYEDESFQQHQHNVPTIGAGSTASVAQGAVTAKNATGIQTDFRGGNETRPLNAYILYIIKT